MRVTYDVVDEGGDECTLSKLIAVKEDTKITCLCIWEDTGPCEVCGRQTHLTSNSRVGNGPGHRLCEEHYKEFHAHHLVVEEDTEQMIEEFNELLKEFFGGE